MRKRKKKKIFSASISPFRKWLLLFLIVCLGVYCIIRIEKIATLENITSVSLPHNYKVLGIDVSHHNGEINWELVKAQGVSFAYIKVTEGTSHLDTYFNLNYKKAKKNEIKVGAYHFFRFYEPVDEQLNHFRSCAMYEKGDLPPMIDVEHSRINYRPTPTQKQSIVGRLKELEQGLFILYGVRPLIYTNKQCYDIYIRNNFPGNKLWICDLTSEPDSTVYPNWVIWQYSHQGHLRGIHQKVDMNVLKGELADIETILIP